MSPKENNLDVVVEARYCNLFTGEWGDWAHWHTFKHKKATSAEKTREVYEKANQQPNDRVQYRIAKAATPQGT